MKTLRLVLCAVLLSACATLGGGGGGTGDGARMRLWEQAHDAFSRDSFRVAAAAFQRLASEYPRTHEGHEARFYLGVLALEPRSSVDLQAAEEHLSIYLVEDSLRNLRGYHDREAETVLALVRQLRLPCASRVSALACEAQVVTVTRPGETAPAPAPASPSSAEVARLRRQLSERDETIRQLRAELERIRNTLAPRPDD
jgi:hypothetical protein